MQVELIRFRKKCRLYSRLCKLPNASLFSQLDGSMHCLSRQYPGAKNIPFADSLLDKHTNMLKTPEQLFRGWLCDYGLPLAMAGMYAYVLSDHNKFKHRIITDSFIVLHQ